MLRISDVNVTVDFQRMRAKRKALNWNYGMSPPGQQWGFTCGFSPGGGEFDIACDVEIRMFP